MPTRKQLEQQYIEDRAFWGSVSSRWRGLGSGMLVGAIGGVLLGLIVATGFNLAAGVSFAEMVPAVVGSKAGLGIIGMFTGAGMLVCGGLQALAGQVSGAIASGIIARKELEQGPSLAMDQEVELKPLTHDVPKNGKLPGPSWKVALLGATITGAIGAFLAYTGMLPPSVNYLLLGKEMGTAAGAGAAAITLGTFGTIFGIGLRPWNKFKKWSDGLFEGRLSGRTIPSMTQLKEQLLDQNITNPQVETPPERSVAYADRVLQERAQTTTVSPRLN